jgi:hypothetical protein
MDHLSDEKKHFIDTFLEAPRLARMATVDRGSPMSSQSGTVGMGR